MTRFALRPTRDRDERGAVGVFLAIMLCVVLIPVAALVVDIGSQRVARSDMQSVADVVALDMARRMAAGALVGTTTQIDNMALARARKMDARLGRDLVVQVHRGHIAANAAFVSNQSRGCGGSGTVHDTYFAAPTAQRPANAVLVVVSSEVDFRLTTPGSPRAGGACQSAVASQYVRSADTPVACFDVGSYALAVNTGNSALIDPLLRQMAMQTGVFSNGGTVQAISYKGLAGTQIDLNRLAVNLGLGSVNDLAKATVSLKSLYNGLVQAVVDTSDQTQVSVLQSLANIASATATVQMDRLLKIGNGAPLSATMNALDLVGGAISLLNGQNTVSVNVAATLPGLANANAQVKVIQSAHRFCGSKGDSFTDTSTTEQLRVTMTASLNPSLRNVTVPLIPGVAVGGSTSVNLSNNVDISVSLAPTTTTIKDVKCTSPEGVDLGVTNGVAEVRLKTYVSNLELRTTTLLGSSISVAVNMQVEAVVKIGPSGEVTWSVRIPPRELNKAYPSAAAAVDLAPALASSTSINANLVLLYGAIGGYFALSTGDRSAIAQAVADAVVRPLFDASNQSSLVNTAIRPVLGLVGAQLGGSDISLASTGCQPSVLPVARAPYLRG